MYGLLLYSINTACFNGNSRFCSITFGNCDCVISFITLDILYCIRCRCTAALSSPTELTSMANIGSQLLQHQKSKAYSR